MVPETDLTMCSLRPPATWRNSLMSSGFHNLPHRTAMKEVEYQIPFTVYVVRVCGDGRPLSCSTLPPMRPDGSRLGRSRHCDRAIQRARSDATSQRLLPVAAAQRDEYRRVRG